MLDNYLKLIWAYLKIGLFGFGGGYAMLSLIQREVVDSGWITSQMFPSLSRNQPSRLCDEPIVYVGL